jgi:hypothetical protein
MSRFTKLEPNAPAPTLEGEEVFSGMNMTLERSALQAVQYALAINKRCNRGVMETRLGTITPVFANLVPFPEILGSGVYNNPNGQEVILIATAHYVGVVRCGSYPDYVKIPAGTTLAGKIEFSQQFDKVLLHRGADPDVDTTTNTSVPFPGHITLQWDGVSTAGFIPIVRTNATDTARTLLPNADYAINFGDRALIPIGKDKIGASELDDYAEIDLILHTFRVNAGTADAITGIYPYPQSQVIVGKERSIDVLHNFGGDLSLVSADILSTEIGISARRTGKMVGSNFIFLFKTGFYPIGQVDQTRIEVSPLPLAATRDAKGNVVDPIAPLIRRIHWPYAKDAVAAVIAPYYFPAFPLDDSKVNNCIAAYNTVTQQWEGYDVWDPGCGIQFDNLLVADYLGQPALYAINHAAKSIHVLYVGMEDETAYDPATGQHSVYQISDLFESRGYATLGWNGGIQRDFKRLVMGFSTWRPQISVTELLDDRQDERVLTPAPITKDPQKHYRFGVPDFDLTNVNGDSEGPSREDYSVVPPAGGVYPGAGITPGWKQSKPEKFSIRARGRYVSYRIANTQGQCDINGLILESTLGGREIRRG